MNGGQEWKGEKGRADHQAEIKVSMTFYAIKDMIAVGRRIFCEPRYVGPFEIVTTDGRTSQSSSSVTLYCTMIIHRLGAASLSL